MYWFLKGQVVAICDGIIVLDVGSVGYEIHASNSLVLDNLVGSVVTVFTHLDVKENSRTLYGFADTTERDVFRVLLGVSGVGAKSALALLSLGVEQLVHAIASGNPHALAKVKGVSTKLADKVILDLKTKILKRFPPGELSTCVVEQPVMSSEIADATLGLLSLGMNKHAIQNVIAKLDTSGMSAEQIIVEVLRGR